MKFTPCLSPGVNIITLNSVVISALQITCLSLLWTVRTNITCQKTLTHLLVTPPYPVGDHSKQVWLYSIKDLWGGGGGGSWDQLSRNEQEKGCIQEGSVEDYIFRRWILGYKLSKYLQEMGTSKYQMMSIKTSPVSHLVHDSVLIL